MSRPRVCGTLTISIDGTVVWSGPFRRGETYGRAMRRVRRSERAKRAERRRVHSAYRRRR